MSGIDAGRDLEVGGVIPRRDIVAKASKRNRQIPLRGGAIDAPAIETVTERRQPMQQTLPRGEEPHVHADPVVALAEGGDQERNRLPENADGRNSGSGDDGCAAR
jgi:hypothetical protein